MKRLSLILLCVCAIVAASAFLFALPGSAEGNVIFIDQSGCGDGDGSSAENALIPEIRVPIPETIASSDRLTLQTNTTFYQAFEQLASMGGTIVVCGPIVLNKFSVHTNGSSADSDVIMPSNAGKITVTSVYDGVDYRKTANASITLADNAHLCVFGQTEWHDLTFLCGSTNRYICFNYYKTVIGEGMECRPVNDANVNNAAYYPSLAAGNRYNGATNKNSDLTVNSGSYQFICGANKGIGANYPHTGTANITINGGTVMSHVYGTSFHNATYTNGNANITINGGVFKGQINGCGRARFKNTDAEVHILVTGGDFSSCTGIYAYADSTTNNAPATSTLDASLCPSAGVVLGLAHYFTETIQPGGEYITSLSVVSEGQTYYLAGDEFSPAGFSFALVYSNGVTAAADAANITFDKTVLTSSDKTVKAIYTDGETPFTVNIGITVQEAGRLPIDMNEDGVFDLLDALTVAKEAVAVASREDRGTHDDPLTEEQKICDLNASGTLDMTDAYVFIDYLTNTELFTRVMIVKSDADNGDGTHTLTYVRPTSADTRVYSATICSLNGNPIAGAIAEDTLLIADFDPETRMLSAYDTLSAYPSAALSGSEKTIALDKNNDAPGEGIFLNRETEFVVGKNGGYLYRYGSPADKKGNEATLTIHAGSYYVIRDNLVLISDGDIAGEFRYEEYYDILEGIVFNITGDSYIQGNTTGANYTWNALLARKYGMDWNNWGRNGATLSNRNVNTGSVELYKFYKEMPDNDPDIVMVVGGRNDFSKYYRDKVQPVSNTTPVGKNTDTDPTVSFKGALNYIIKGLKEKYPNALIVFGTSWYTGDKNSATAIPMTDYTDATLEICALWGVPCFHAADPAQSGVDMSDPDFRALYSETASDKSHLNEIGMQNVLPNFERFLAREYARFLESK